jgi:hypothetical protein
MELWGAREKHHNGNHGNHRRWKNMEIMEIISWKTSWNNIQMWGGGSGNHGKMMEITVINT